MSVRTAAGLRQLTDGRVGGVGAFVGGRERGRRVPMDPARLRDRSGAPIHGRARGWVWPVMADSAMATAWRSALM